MSPVSCVATFPSSYIQHSFRAQEVSHGDSGSLQGFCVLSPSLSVWQDEMLSGMACQTLVNFSYDVFGRCMLLEWEGLGEVVQRHMHKDVDTKISLARLIGNLALDTHGRKTLRGFNAMESLTGQLCARDENGQDAVELRRAAIWAISKCASDRTLAVRLCDIGALCQLLELMDTHKSKLGQVAGDAVDRLLQKNTSAKFWLRGEVDFEDMAADGWFDMSVGRPYTSLEDLQDEKANMGREVLLADISIDKELKAMLDLVDKKCEQAGLTRTVLDRRDIEATVIKKECIKAIAHVISDRMGGSVSYEKYNDFEYASEVNRCKQLRGSNVIWIGDLNKGTCRHRAFLFKYICDIKLPRLCRLERVKFERGGHVGHAWNVVKFYGDVDHEGNQQSYTVDLMHDVGALLHNGTDVLPPDEKLFMYNRNCCLWSLPIPAGWFFLNSFAHLYGSWALKDIHRHINICCALL